MVRLDNIKKKGLFLKDLEKYPIWTWDDSNEYYSPVDSPDLLSDEYGIYFIKSRFIAPDETAFTGYLTGLESYYAFAFFVNKECFGFNLTLPSLAIESLADLRRALGRPDFELFPLRYESQVRDLQGKHITGIFSTEDFVNTNL
jgi:hypothetical protein